MHTCTHATQNLRDPLTSRAELETPKAQGDESRDSQDKAEKDDVDVRARLAKGFLQDLGGSLNSEAAECFGSCKDSPMQYKSCAAEADWPGRNILGATGLLGHSRQV